MTITQEKLTEFVEDRKAYFEGRLSYRGKKLGSSGILDEENAKYKKAIDAAMTKVDETKRPGYFNEEEITTGLSFQDSEGRIHKAYAPKERLFKGSEDFSVGKIIRAKILGNFTDLNDYERKAAGEGIGAMGGWLVPTEVSAKVIDMARNLACVMQAGAYTIEMPTPEMRLVKITSDPTAYWVGEHTAITESDWTLEPITLKAVTLGVLVRSSLELLEDAKNSGSALEASMAAAIALELDRVALLGSGTGEPRGLDNCDNVNLLNMGVNGNPMTSYDNFSASVEAIADFNGIAGAVIMAPRTYFTLDRFKEATTNAPLQPPQSYADLKKFVSNQIGIADTQGTATNASKAFIGDFRNLLYGIRTVLEVEFTKQGGTTFAQCEALIRCRMRLDVAVLRENAFTKIYGIIV